MYLCNCNRTVTTIFEILLPLNRKRRKNDKEHVTFCRPDLLYRCNRFKKQKYNIKKIETMSAITEVAEILVPLACGCVLPITVVWMIVRHRMNETNQRTQIILTAIEKNPELDLEELMKKITPKKLLKEKLLAKLLRGCLSTLLGLGLIGYGIFLNVSNLGGKDDPMTSICIGLILLAIGIAFIVNYTLGKKMLAKEIETEEKTALTQTERK